MTVDRATKREDRDQAGTPPNQQTELQPQPRGGGGKTSLDSVPGFLGSLSGSMTPLPKGREQPPSASPTSHDLYQLTDTYRALVSLGCHDDDTPEPGGLHNPSSPACKVGSTRRPLLLASPVTSSLFAKTESKGAFWYLFS